MSFIQSLSIMCFIFNEHRVLSCVAWFVYAECYGRIRKTNKNKKKESKKRNNKIVGIIYLYGYHFILVWLDELNTL